MAATSCFFRVLSMQNAANTHITYHLYNPTKSFYVPLSFSKKKKKEDWERNCLCFSSFYLSKLKTTPKAPPDTESLYARHCSKLPTLKQPSRQDEGHSQCPAPVRKPRHRKAL